MAFRLARIALALAGLVALAAAQAQAERFDFFVVGDAPYCSPPRDDGRCYADDRDDMARFGAVKDFINRAKPVPAFTVHVGDIKRGGDPCADEVYARIKELFNAFEQPLIYTPGDNEWTDCKRPYDPEERLKNMIRPLFFGDPPGESLGRKGHRMPLEQQSGTSENARWQRGGITFATLHVVGNDDDAGRAESKERRAAVLNWLAETFDRARDRNAAAVVLFMQADPRFDVPGERPPFASLIAALRKHTLAFAKPVVLFHGDTHRFRVDKPLRLFDYDPRERFGANKLIESFTRVEVFGAPEVHAVRVRVDTDSKQESDLFWFQPVMIRENFHRLP